MITKEGLSWISPLGTSVNDAVTRDNFDGSSFTLESPTVDNIVDDIKQRKGRVPLAKIDVARAFAILRWTQPMLSNFT